MSALVGVPEDARDLHKAVYWLFDDCASLLKYLIPKNPDHTSRAYSRLYQRTLEIQNATETVWEQFRLGRLAVVSNTSETPTIELPNGHHFPSYHDAAIYIVCWVLLDLRAADGLDLPEIFRLVQPVDDLQHSSRPLQEVCESCLQTFPNTTFYLSQLELEFAAIPLPRPRPKDLAKASTNDERDRWLYEQWQNSNKPAKEILKELRDEHPEWDPLEQPASLNAALNRFTTRNGLPLSKRKQFSAKKR